MLIFNKKKMILVATMLTPLAVNTAIVPVANAEENSPGSVNIRTSGSSDNETFTLKNSSGEDVAQTVTSPNAVGVIPLNGLGSNKNMLQISLGKDSKNTISGVQCVAEDSGNVGDVKLPEKENGATSGDEANSNSGAGTTSVVVPGDNNAGGATSTPTPSTKPGNDASDLDNIMQLIPAGVRNIINPDVINYVKNNPQIIPGLIQSKDKIVEEIKKDPVKAMGAVQSLDQFKKFIAQFQNSGEEKLSLNEGAAREQGFNWEKATPSQRAEKARNLYIAKIRKIVNEETNPQQKKIAEDFLAAIPGSLNPNKKLVQEAFSNKNYQSTLVDLFATRYSEKNSGEVELGLVSQFGNMPFIKQLISNYDKLPLIGDFLRTILRNPVVQGIVNVGGFALKALAGPAALAITGAAAAAGLPIVVDASDISTLVDLLKAIVNSPDTDEAIDGLLDEIKDTAEGDKKDTKPDTDAPTPGDDSANKDNTAPTEAPSDGGKNGTVTGGDTSITAISGIAEDGDKSKKHTKSDKDKKSSVVVANDQNSVTIEASGTDKIDCTVSLTPKATNSSNNDNKNDKKGDKDKDNKDNKDSKKKSDLDELIEKSKAESDAALERIRQKSAAIQQQEAAINQQRAALASQPVAGPKVDTGGHLEKVSLLEKIAKLLFG